LMPVIALSHSRKAGELSSLIVVRMVSGSRSILLQSSFIFVIVFIVDPAVRFIQPVEFSDALPQHDRIGKFSSNMCVRLALVFFTQFGSWAVHLL